MGKFHQLFKLNRMAIDLAGKALSIRRYPDMLRSKALLKRNVALKNLRKSDTCCILGLGPSLKEVDLHKLDGDIFAVNGFFNFSDATSIKPLLYCITDDLDYTDPNYHSIESAMDMFPDTTFMLNGRYRMQAEKKIGARKNTRYFANMWAGYFNPDKEIDFTKNLPVMGNIIGFCIMAAMYMGYQRIVLLGCDFNSFAFRTQAHCYEDEDDSRTMRLSYELFCYAFCADEHDLLFRYAKKHGVEIVNATKGSLIDAYPYDEELIQHFLKT